MTLKADNRVYETTVTTGTGNYALLGAVTGFTTFADVIGNNDTLYCVTDDTNWEIGIGTISGGTTLARTTVLRSTNVNAAVNWGAGSKKVRCEWPAEFAMLRVLSKSVAGSSNVTLTQDEMRKDVLVFTGLLTGNIEVRVDATPWKWPAVINSTTGAFKITFIVTGQTGFVLQRGRYTPAICDGTDVRPVENTVHRKAADVASATTTDLNINGDLADVTGTTTITGITLEEGREVTARFTGALILTHGANLVLPGAANITTAAGDMGVFRGYASGVTRMINFAPFADAANSQMKQGKHSFTIPARALKPKVTGGCAVLATSDGGTTDTDIDYLAFDPAARESCGICVQMPRDWDLGTLTARFSWIRASGTSVVNAVWGMRALVVRDTDSLQTNMGSDATVVAAAANTANKLAISGETGACTPAGTAGVGAEMFLEFFRDGTSGSDTLDGVDALLVQVTVFYTTNAKNEA